MVENAASSADEMSGQDNDSQLVETLPPREQLKMFGEILVVRTGDGWVLLVSSKQRPGMLLKFLQCIGKHPPHTYTHTPQE